MAQLSAACAVRTAKQELRKALRSVLAAMTEQQRQEESEVLVRKVDGGRGRKGEGRGRVRREGGSCQNAEYVSLCYCRMGDCII